MRPSRRRGDLTDVRSTAADGRSSTHGTHAHANPGEPSRLCTRIGVVRSPRRDVGAQGGRGRRRGWPCHPLSASPEGGGALQQIRLRHGPRPTVGPHPPDVLTSMRGARPQTVAARVRPMHHTHAHANPGEPSRLCTRIGVVRSPRRDVGAQGGRGRRRGWLRHPLSASPEGGGALQQMRLRHEPRPTVGPHPPDVLTSMHGPRPHAVASPPRPIHGGRPLANPGSRYPLAPRNEPQRRKGRKEGPLGARGVA